MAWKVEGACAECPVRAKEEPVRQQPWKPARWLALDPGKTYRIRRWKDAPKGVLGLSEEKVSE